MSSCEPPHHASALQRQRALTRNEPRPAVPGEIVPGPLHEHQQSVVELDEIHQMDEQPREPGEEATEAQAAGDVGDRGVAADDRHGAAIAIVEWRRWLAA